MFFTWYFIKIYWYFRTATPIFWKCNMITHFYNLKIKILFYTYGQILLLFIYMYWYELQTLISITVVHCHKKQQFATEVSEVYNLYHVIHLKSDWIYSMTPVLVNENIIAGPVIPGTFNDKGPTTTHLEESYTSKCSVWSNL